MWIIPSAQLKHGKGMDRGKSDKADAKKIALYRFTHPHEVRLRKQLRVVLKQLKALIKNRGGIIKTKHLYERRLRESKGLVDKKELSTSIKPKSQCIA
mgnify:CR=1 FL=1